MPGPEDQAAGGESQGSENELELELTQGSDGSEGAEGAKPNDGEGSSASQTQEAPKDLLSVVRDAAPAKAKTEGDAAASSAEGGAKAGDKPGDAPKGPPPEDYSDVPFNKHPRFRQLLQERNSNVEDATRYRQVDTFIKDNGMTAQEAADLLIVGGMAKTDPAKAWELAKPWVERLLQAAGEVLPADLAKMVQDGTMTEEAAYQVSRSRATVASVEASRTFERQKQERSAQETAEGEYRQAAVDWETDRRAKDPNFEAKLEPILREIAWRKSQGDVPKTPAEVTAQLNAVYKAVNDALKPPANLAAPAPGARPAPQQRKAVTPVAGGSVSGGNAKPAPRSMLEVVQQAQG
jgi:hypothetical protein